MGKADKTPRWIAVDGAAFIRGSRVLEREPAAANEGAYPKGTAAVSLSVYDVPGAVRAHAQDSNGAVVIELRYLTQGEPRTAVQKDSVTFMLGSRTGRIYQIKAFPTPSTTDELAVIRAALKKLAAEAQEGFGPRQRINVVAEIITEHWEELKPD